MKVPAPSHCAPTALLLPCYGVSSSRSPPQSRLTRWCCEWCTKSKSSNSTCVCACVRVAHRMLVTLVTRVNSPSNLTYTNHSADTALCVSMMGVGKWLTRIAKPMGSCSWCIGSQVVLPDLILSLCVCLSCVFSFHLLPLGWALFINRFTSICSRQLPLLLPFLGIHTHTHTLAEAPTEPG